jgi:hypothetical protein
MRCVRQLRDAPRRAAANDRLIALLRFTSASVPPAIGAREAVGRSASAFDIRLR